MKLRRALGWDALILARRWHNLAEAGTGIYGPIPQEIRVWIVDKRPIAWCFHYLNVLNSPKGFPPSGADLRSVYKLAEKVGTVFDSSLSQYEAAVVTLERSQREGQPGVL